MKRFLKRLLNHIPTKLPQGMTEMNIWADDVLDTYNMPNNDSIKFALATAVMHAPPSKGYVPKSYFGNILMKGAATQVAYAVMQECKARQAEAEKEAAEAKLAEVTASTKDVDTSCQTKN